jgi:hypothetical protein
MQRETDNQDLWSNYIVKIGRPTVETETPEKAMNYPLLRAIRNMQVSYSAIAQKSSRAKTVQTVSTIPATVVSTTLSISHSNCNEEAEGGIQQLKRKLDAIDKEWV